MIPQVKIGDKIKILNVKGAGGTMNPDVGKFDTVRNVNYSGSIDVHNFCWRLDEGDFELVTDFADDPQIKDLQNRIRINSEAIVRDEAKITARRAELIELAKPKPTLPAIEKRWADLHGACDAVRSFCGNYESLLKAYAACDNSSWKRRSWEEILGISATLASALKQTGENPFTLPQFKTQLEALEASK